MTVMNGGRNVCKTMDFGKERDRDGDPNADSLPAGCLEERARGKSD